MSRERLGHLEKDKLVKKFDTPSDRKSVKIDRLLFRCARTDYRTPIDYNSGWE
jgi:hypothetical protein